MQPTPIYSGKVRDIYDAGDGQLLLVTDGRAREIEVDAVLAHLQLRRWPEPDRERGVIGVRCRSEHPHGAAEEVGLRTVEPVEFAAGHRVTTGGSLRNRRACPAGAGRAHPDS